MEVTGAVFAKLCGVSRAAICILKKNKSPKIVFNSAGLIDTDNPVNRMYLEQHQEKMREKLELGAMEAAVRNDSACSAPAPLPDGSVPAAGEPPCGDASFSENVQGVSGPEKPAASGAPVYSERKKTGVSWPMATPDSAAELQRMTIGQLVRKYGSMDGVEKYSKILTNLTIADERGQRLQERRNQQIPKDFVVQRVFAYVDQLMNQLLDVPEAVCDQVIAVSLAGGDGVRVSVMHILSDNLTKCIAGAKEHITSELAALKGKYDRQDDTMLAIQKQLETMREA